MRESHRHPGLAKGMARTIAVGDIVIIHNDAHPRGLWKLGKVESLITGADGHTRGATVRVLSSGQNTTVLKRPVQRLYPLEVQAETNEMASDPQDAPRPTLTDSANPVDSSESNISAELVPQQSAREKRKAFIRAQGNLKQ